MINDLLSKNVRNEFPLKLINEIFIPENFILTTTISILNFLMNDAKLKNKK